MPPKKASPGITALLIDVGPSMAAKSSENQRTDFERAQETADWIISRKLFAQDPELFTVLACNSAEQDGIVIENEEFSPASFDHLKFINGALKLNEKGKNSNKNVFHGVNAAISLLKAQLEISANPSGITLILLTNGLENLKNEYFDLLSESISEINADFMVIGIDENSQNRLIEFAESLEGRSYSFENVAKMLSSYQARQKSERKYNKMWDIAPGIRLPVTFAVKSEKSTALLKFKNADSDGNEMVRMEQMHVETQNYEENITKVSKNDDDEFMEKPGESSGSFKIPESKNLGKTLKAVEKIKTLHGYNFGKTPIMIDPEYMKEKYNDHNFNEGQTGGSLKLIQFTKRANILDSYLLDASAKTVLPALNSPKSATTVFTVSLIEAMLSLRVAAICRYSFHAKSHIQLVALLPHQDEETGVFYLRSVKLPFSDDMRSLKFPKFSFDDDEVDTNKPTVAQLSAVDDLIDSMQLKEEDISSLVEGGMSDPKLQMQCHFLKSLVLHPEDPLEMHSTRTSEILNKIMAPKRKIETENPEIFEKLGRQFNLQTIEKSKREKVSVAPEDLQNMIDEYKMKKEDSVDESPTKKKKTKKENSVKKSRKEEIEEEMEENGGAAKICSKMIQMISNTCMFQTNGAVSGFFELLINDLKTIRSVFVGKSKFEEFNELLKKLKDDEDFEPFAAILAEEKTCNPINSSEVASSDISEFDAAEFWEEED